MRRSSSGSSSSFEVVDPDIPGPCAHASGAKPKCGSKDVLAKNPPIITERVDLQSEDKLELVMRLLKAKIVNAPDNMRYVRNEKKKTELIINGEKPAVLEFSTAIIEHFATKQIRTVPIPIRSDLAELFLRQINSDNVPNYVTEFLDDIVNTHVVILPYNYCGNRSLAASAFEQDQAEQAASRFERQLLCAHVSIAFVTDNGKRKIRNFIENQKKCRAVITVKETERHIEVYGAPRDVIELVGLLEKMVYEDESQGGWQR